MTPETLIEAVAEELATVIGALLDVRGAVESAPEVGTPVVLVQLTLAGPSPATLTVGLEHAPAVQLATLVTGDGAEPAPAAVVDTLQELCGQAIGALSQREGFGGVRLADAVVQTTAPTAPPVARRIVAGDRYSATLSLWARVDDVAAFATPAAPARSAPNLELILDIDLPLAVRFGETEMTLQSLTRLAPGSVIDLGRAPDDPVDVLVNGKLVARGEVVVVSGNYGVRIVEVISPADRLKSVAA